MAPDKLLRQRREELEQQQEEKLELEEKYSSTEEQVWLIYPSEKPLKKPLKILRFYPYGNYGNPCWLMMVDDYSEGRLY